jgi:hypothetical protein
VLSIPTNPAIFGKAMREQFKKFVLEPLSHISAEAHKDSTLLIIVDALDECDGEEDVKLLIKLLVESISYQQTRTSDLPRIQGY